MTDAQLNAVAQQVSSVMYELGAALGLPPADLATVASVLSVNVNFWAHGAAGIEHIRTAADVAERQLRAEALQ